MTSSDSSQPETPTDEAQQAADGLKDQIAAVRDRIRQARETLTEHAKRESRTFKG
jgi:hypothetical protein